MSAKAEPIPAAKKPYRGDNINPESNTIQSPRFIYPLRGEGIFIIIVATQQSAANMAEITICVVLLFFILYTPIEILSNIVYNKSDNIEIFRKEEKDITR